MTNPVIFSTMSDGTEIVSCIDDDANSEDSGIMTDGDFDLDNDNYNTDSENEELEPDEDIYNSLNELFGNF